MKSKQFQSGSLGSYVVVAVLLTLVLVGGLYGLQRYISTQDDTKETAQEKSSDTSDNSSKSDNKKATEDEDTSTDTSGSESTASDDSASTDTSDSDNEALPTTGPADSIVSLLAVSLLTFATVSFLVSRSRLGWTSERN